MKINGKDLELAAEIYDFNANELACRYTPDILGGSGGKIEFLRPNGTKVQLEITKRRQGWVLRLAIANHDAIGDCFDTKTIADPRVRQVAEAGLVAWQIEATKARSSESARRAAALAKFENRP